MVFPATESVQRYNNLSIFDRYVSLIQVFVNNWFSSAYAKTTTNVEYRTWTSGRQEDSVWIWPSGDIISYGLSSSLGVHEHLGIRADTYKLQDYDMNTAMGVFCEARK